MPPLMIWTVAPLAGGVTPIMRMTRTGIGSVRGERAAGYLAVALLAHGAARIAHVGVLPFRHPAVAALHVVAVALARVAVDQRPGIERMGDAPDLVLDLEQLLAGRRIDDVVEAILVLVALLGEDLALDQRLVRLGEVGDIDLDVMAVVSRGLLVGLTEHQLLAVADRDLRRPVPYR